MRFFLAALLLAAPAFAADPKDLGIETDAGVESRKPNKPVLKPIFAEGDAAAEKPNPKRPAIQDVDKDDAKETGSKKFKRTPLKPLRKGLLKPIKKVPGGQDETKAGS